VGEVVPGDEDVVELGLETYEVVVRKGREQIPVKVERLC
jgi:hypothetical protein